jgi:transcriptional regulator with XRE-family HTH domain
MNSEVIGKFIQGERKKLNIIQEELANMIHVSNKAVSKWENGKGMPSIDYIVLLAKTFNVFSN